MSLENYIQPDEEVAAWEVIKLIAKWKNIRLPLLLDEPVISKETSHELISTALSVGLAPYMTVAAGLEAKDVASSAYENPDQFAEEIEFIRQLWPHIPVASEVTKGRKRQELRPIERSEEDQRIDRAIDFVRGSVIWFVSKFGEKEV